MNPLEIEIAYRLAQGDEQLSIAAFGARFMALGYRLDRTMDCRSNARYLDSGRSYPCITTSVRESDSGLSAFNFDARRDSNFRAMQQLRQQIFAVSRGAILEV